MLYKAIKKVLLIQCQATNQTDVNAFSLVTWKDNNKLERENKSFSEQINQELRTFQQELPLISLEMQIILNFMDKKRNMIKNLLRIVETNNDELLGKIHVWNDILEDEYKELKNDLSKNTIEKVLSNRKFVPMNSDI